MNRYLLKKKKMDFMTGKKDRIMDDVFFSVNNIIFGYDGSLIFKIDENQNEEIIASFENITLMKITKNYAIFYFHEYNKYLKFNGEEFTEDFTEIGINEFNKICYELVQKYDDEYSKKMDVVLPQIRFIVDGDDLINRNNGIYSFHYGIHIDKYFEQKEKIVQGRFLVGICGCTCEGCDDIVATIGCYQDAVYWDVYNEVGGGPVNGDHKYFVFKKTKYESIINQLNEELQKYLI